MTPLVASGLIVDSMRGCIVRKRLGPEWWAQRESLCRESERSRPRGLQVSKSLKDGNLSAYPLPFLWEPNHKNNEQYLHLMLSINEKPLMQAICSSEFWEEVQLQECRGKVKPFDSDKTNSLMWPLKFPLEWCIVIYEEEQVIKHRQCHVTALNASRWLNRKSPLWQIYNALLIQQVGVSGWFMIYRFSLCVFVVTHT